MSNKMILFATVVLAVFLPIVSGKEFVATVRQNYKNVTNSLLIRQIEKELSASYIYLGYASYFERADVSLPGISKFFSDASLEERDHAQLLIDYVNKRGGYVHYDKIDMKSSCEAVLKYLEKDDSGFKSNVSRMCICGFVATQELNSECGAKENWTEGLMAFQDALAVERFVTDELLTIHAEAELKKDAHLTYIIEHELLDEQITSINKIAKYVTQLLRFAQGNNYKLGEYIFDQHII